MRSEKTPEGQKIRKSSAPKDASQINLKRDKEIDPPKEHKPESKIIKKSGTDKKSLQTAILAIFTALGPALSLSFIWFPYFELMTLTLFTGGLVLGPITGVILAVLSSTLYEIIATLVLGPALTIYPFKILAYILIALTGSLIGKNLPEKPTFSWRFFTGIIGGLLTLFFDLVVNLGMIFFMDLQTISYFTTLLVGLPVTALRVISNTVLFSFIPELVSRAVYPLLDKYKKDKKMTNNDFSLKRTT